MDPRSKLKYGLGCLIADCVLILEIIIDIYTGRLTQTELLLQIMFCVILTVPVVVLFKRIAKKDKQRFGSKKTEDQNSEDATE